MPLTHFPAKRPLSACTSGMVLDSGRTRGEPEPADTFDAIVWRHCFVYAGPSCFALRPEALGDTAFYFAPGAEDGDQGLACPFDTGACKPGGRLRPFAARSAKECHELINRSSCALGDWRTSFAKWLGHCYDTQHVRYLATSDDPYADGLPDRTAPPKLLKHNGVNGRKRAPDRLCADRRAWTWELRLTGSLPLQRASALHVLPRLVKKAEEFADEVEELTGSRPAVHELDVDESAGPTHMPRLLYVQSEKILKSLIGVP
jgi:hypothetical protein